MYQLRLLVGHGVSYIQIGEKAMATKEKGRTFDGITRPSNDLYRENFNKIFGKKEKTTSELLREGYEEEKRMLENEEE
jgi:hypothetical protein